MPIEHKKWDEERQQAGFDMYDEGHKQVQSEDIDLDAMRTSFQQEAGRATTLNDDQLLVVYMSTDDDSDDERNGYISSAEAYFATDEGKAKMHSCIEAAGLEPLTPPEHNGDEAESEASA